MSLGAARLSGQEQANSISVDECIAILESRSREAPGRVVVFREERVFPFRSGAVVLEGIARVSAEAGVSIEYPEKGAVMVIDGEGALLRRFGPKGDPRDRRIDRGRSDALTLLGAALDFQEQALREQFEMEAEGGPNRWTLRLSPKEEGAGLLGVAIESDAQRLRSIEIRLEADRQIRIEIEEETRQEGFSSEELSRYFR